MSTKPTVRTAHYILSSHWDREWYQTFQQYRFRLVRLMDRVLDLIGSGKLKGPFTCDGQAITLRDYLEVRPEKSQEIRRLLAEGNLVAGPWFVLPDEFLVSGESLVRNIRYGRQLVREWGGTPSDAGFACDLFGHCSQLPQILAGFGVKAALVWRGINPLPDARFWWESPDGTALPAWRFGKSGYCDYSNKVRHAFEPRLKFDAERAGRELEGFLKEEFGRTSDGPALVFDGADHMEIDEAHYALIVDKIEKRSGTRRMMHSTLDGFIADLLTNFKGVKQRVRGELRAPSSRNLTEDQQFLIPGVGSSRVGIKQANAACQSLLCRWAEPFSLLATRETGAEHPDSYLRIAWDWLLQNHPHDSICGCSIDQVHQDMRYRFDQCRQIAEELTANALRALAYAPKLEKNAPPAMHTLVANPLPRPRNDVQTLTIGIPEAWPKFTEFFGYENKPAFRLFDSGGKELPYQLLAHKPGQIRRRIHAGHFTESISVHEVSVAARLPLPALGCATFVIQGEVEKAHPTERGPLFIEPTRHAAAPGIAKAPHVLDNGHLRIEVQPSGMLSLTDLETGIRHEGLLAFEDEADIGDGWYHGPSVNDERLGSAVGRAEVALLHNGPLLATIRVRVTLQLPAHFDRMTASRSEMTVPLVLDNLLTLRAGARELEVETRVTNTARDHRLRVVFPSGAKTGRFLADSPFDVVERDIALDPDNHTLRELEVEAKPQQSWTAVHDAKRGLAVVTDGGLLEAGVRDTPDRPLMLTLYRSTGRTIFTNGEPDGQLVGEPMAFRYAIVPLRGAPDRLALFDLAHSLAAPVRSLDSYIEDAPLLGTKSRPPVSLAGVDGAVLTSFRQADGASEIRVFNPLEHPAPVRFTCPNGAPWNKSMPVDLESRPLGKAAPVTDPVRLNAKQIVTLRLS